MTYHAADSRSGPLLFITAAASLLALACALGAFTSVLLILGRVQTVRALGGFSLAGLLLSAPVAIGGSLMLRCRACDKLLLPLVYNGKSLFAAKSPSAFAILATAISVVMHRRAPCPHCGVEAQV